MVAQQCCLLIGRASWVSNERRHGVSQVCRFVPREEYSMTLADSVAQCQVRAAAEIVDIVAAPTVAINPACILFSAGLAHTNDS